MVQPQAGGLHSWVSWPGFYGTLGARWGDYNSFIAILVLLDWKTGFFGLNSGLLMIFFGADVWTPQDTVLAGLAAAAFVSIIGIAFRIFTPGGDRAKFQGRVVDREGGNDTDAL